jgi:putative DNA primase/helicase
MRLIPFTVTIPENKRNPDLAEELIKELPGILNWAIDGCRDWLQDGLQIPDLVKVATAGYKAEMDTVGTFIEDACVLSSKVETSSGELYKAFCAWCESSGERPITQMSFSLRLEEKGFEKVKTKSCKLFKGIGIEAST